MRITIIGASGSGKSTLAKNISTTFGIPRLEIDRIWFKYDGHLHLNSTEDVKEQILHRISVEVEEFMSRNDNWVIDGTYLKIQPAVAGRSDQVVFVQRPLVFRVWSHIVRVVCGTDRHPEVSRTQDFLFVKTIIKRWFRGEDQQNQKFLESYASKRVVLRNFKEINLFFESLKLKHFHD